MDEALQSLSEREKETLRLLARGHDAKSVARLLDLSVHTVNERLRSARNKLGLSSSRAAARRLVEAEAGGASQAYMERPKFLGDKELGGDPTAGGVRVAASSQSRRVISSTRWIIGGLAVMLSLAVAALIFTYAAGPAAAPTNSPPQPVPSVEAAELGEGAEAALAWIALLDREQWVDSWDAAGSLFQAQVTQANWASTVASVRETVGPVVARTQISVAPSTTLPGLPAGEYQVIQYRTAFRDKTESVETAVLMRERGTWKVIGYFIR
jgi:DNA-binding CsgD family transcriptional regulator